jgi:hypothetical protein
LFQEHVRRTEQLDDDEPPSQHDATRRRIREWQAELEREEAAQLQYVLTMSAETAYYESQGDTQEVDSQEYLKGGVEMEGESANQKECRVLRECEICLDDITTSQKLRTLPCMHVFHAGCVSAWLRKQPVCPICRISTLAASHANDAVYKSLPQAMPLVAAEVSESKQEDESKEAGETEQGDESKEVSESKQEDERKEASESKQGDASQEASESKQEDAIQEESDIKQQEDERKEESEIKQQEDSSKEASESDLKARENAVEERAEGAVAGAVEGAAAKEPEFATVARLEEEQDEAMGEAEVNAVVAAEIAAEIAAEAEKVQEDDASINDVVAAKEQECAATIV